MRQMRKRGLRNRRERLAAALTGSMLVSLAFAVAPVAGLPSAAHAAPARAPAGCLPVTPEAAAAVFAPLAGTLTRTRVPGAVVSVVSGGGTVFSEGYGLADAERLVRFDPDRSLVRIASITKLLTATAVMQQVEAGRLDLDADVNRYLTGFTIPATYPEPVTVGDLLDHTAGFEDKIIGTGARSAADVPPLGDYLAAHVPARIRPPGVVSAYSNYGAALAGHLVELVSGEPYAVYIKRHVLDPLGMTHSTAAEPVPAPLAADLARSYNSDETPIRRVPFQFDRLAPDGSVSATAADMARFMDAHLHPERAPAVLRPETFALMRQRSFSADPRLDGYAHGFKEKTVNGHRVLMHDGGWEGFLSILMLVPDCDLGLFVSINGTSGAEAAGELTEAFFDRFSPSVDGAAGSVDASAQSDAPTAPGEPAAGFYASTRRNESTMERILTLMGPRRLSVDADGTVRFRGEEWKAQGEGLYRQVDGEERISFRRGPGGERYVITDGSAYEQLGPSDTLPVNGAIVGLFALTALSALALPVVLAWRRLRRRARTASTRWAVARWVTAVGSLLGLGFLVGFVLTLAGDTGDYLYGAPLGFRLLLTIPLLVAVVAVAGSVATVTGWRGAGVGIVARIHQVGLLAGLVALGWFAWRWNLVGWWSV